MGAQRFQQKRNKLERTSKFIRGEHYLEIADKPAVQGTIRETDDA